MFGSVKAKLFVVSLYVIWIWGIVRHTVSDCISKVARVFLFSLTFIIQVNLFVDADNKEVLHSPTLKLLQREVHKALYRYLKTMTDEDFEVYTDAQRLFREEYSLSVLILEMKKEQCGQGIED